MNTRLLASLARQEIDARSVDVLFVACQEELRAAAGNLMKGERPNHTLRPTALVNEVYLKLFDVDDLPVTSRLHFVNIAARTMRRILVDHARCRQTIKRGDGWRPVTLAGIPEPGLQDPLELLALHDALENLAALDPRAVEVVELRIFGGLKMEEIATLLGVSRRTIQNEWRFAIRWLRREFVDAGSSGD